MSKKKNKGEWSEAYVAVRLLADKKLKLVQDNGSGDGNGWLEVIELIRKEASECVTRYSYSKNFANVDIFMDDTLLCSVNVDKFSKYADELKECIKSGKNSSFSLPMNLDSFLNDVRLINAKGFSNDKSDINITVSDPISGIVREHIGFSIKSNLGHNPTLFNTSTASAAVFNVSHMNDSLMDTVNGIVNSQGKASMFERCKFLKDQNCGLSFVGFEFAKRAKCRAFEENLSLINPRLVEVFSYILYKLFFDNYPREIPLLVKRIIEDNPCEISNPEIKYPYMMKCFLYACYCGLTASTIWNGESQVNGGFIKVDSEGNVIGYYGLESNSFKTYLYENCYFDFPGTDKGHGNYGSIEPVVENGIMQYQFKLNFQIRYK